LPPATAEALSRPQVKGSSSFAGRSRAQVARFFDDNGLVPVDPGLTVVSDWRPDPGTTPPPPEHVSVYGAVARKL
jgi:hypothetical protein